MQAYALLFLVAVATGGIAWVFVYPILSGERTAERRLASLARSQPAGRQMLTTAQKPRREQIESALKELEERKKKAKRVPLSARISQSGLDWSKRRFVLFAIGLGVAALAVALGLRAGPLPSLGFAFAAGCGLPSWMLSFLKKRRQARFLNALPDAVDVIIRGIKAGLPLHTSLKMIAAEAPEPVRSEFRAIVEAQTVGVPIGEACLKLYERIPMPEANFFGIVISIQQRTGGNLSEALGNLSRVLRDRKQMKAKIRAMSQEAKASASIIGALPILVMALVYATTPSYIELLWTSSHGRLLLGGGAIWMCIGTLVMRKMINFEF